MRCERSLSAVVSGEEGCLIATCAVPWLHLEPCWPSAGRHHAKSPPAFPTGQHEQDWRNVSEDAKVCDKIAGRCLLSSTQVKCESERGGQVVLNE